MVIICLQRKNPPNFKRRILRICRLLPLCLIFLFVSTIFPQYRIENWSTEQGLPYKTVRSVLQTRNGYIWAATSDGLARFDGVRFTVFNTANSPGLKTNRLAQLAETADGSLRISSEDASLFRLKSGGVFTSVSIAVAKRNFSFSFVFYLSIFKTVGRQIIFCRPTVSHR